LSELGFFGLVGFIGYHLTNLLIPRIPVQTIKNPVVLRPGFLRTSILVILAYKNFSVADIGYHFACLSA